MYRGDLRKRLNNISYARMLPATFSLKGWLCPTNYHSSLCHARGHRAMLQQL